MQSAGSQSKVTAPAKAGAGHFKVLRALGSAALLSGLVLAGALVVAGDELDVPEAQAREATGVVPYRDGPPLGFSGGFGEDHCQACHNSEKLNVSPGTVTLSAPGRYAPGKVYTVTVTLKRPGLKVGGFMFTARFEDDSTQAGTLALGDGQQGRIKIVDDRGIQYAYHSRAGTELTGTHTVRWTLRWTAPEGNRAVLFHVASNAANADDTPFGDFIYTSRTRSTGR